jgi:hypothetical protein
VSLVDYPEEKISSNFSHGDTDLFRNAEEIVTSRILLEENNEPGQGTYNLTLRFVCVTIVAV